MLRLQEKILLHRVRRGDQTAFAKLYNEYIEEIQRFVIFKVSDKNKSEELANTIFVKTLNYLLKGEAIENFRALLYQIARSTIIDFYRANTKKNISLEEVAEKEFGEEIESDEKLDIKLNLEKIKEALTQIPDHYREILVLRFVNEMSFKEIAKITGQKESSNRMMVHRGIKELRKALEKTKNKL